MRAGREKSVAATKTYTGQLMVLYTPRICAGREASYCGHGKYCGPCRQRPDARNRGCRPRGAYPLHASCGRGGARLGLCELAGVRFERRKPLRDRRGFLVGGLSAWTHRHGGTEFSGIPVHSIRRHAWPSMHQMLVRLHSLKAPKQLAITDRRNPGGSQSCLAGHLDPRAYSGTLFADTVHYPRPVVRRRVGEREKSGPRPTADLEQGHTKPVSFHVRKGKRIISCASDPPSKPNHARRCSLSAGGHAHRSGCVSLR